MSTRSSTTRLPLCCLSLGFAPWPSHPPRAAGLVAARRDTCKPRAEAVERCKGETDRTGSGAEFESFISGFRRPKSASCESPASRRLSAGHPADPEASPNLDPRNANAPARRGLNEVPSFDFRFSPRGPLTALTAIIIDPRWNPMRAVWRTSPASTVRLPRITSEYGASRRMGTAERRTGHQP
jgi:hypothetical protein